MSLTLLLASVTVVGGSQNYHAVDGLEFSHDGQYLVTYGNEQLDSRLYVWKVEALLKLEFVRGCSAGCRSVSWSSKNALVFNSLWGVVIWNPKVWNVSARRHRFCFTKN